MGECRRVDEEWLRGRGVTIEEFRESVSEDARWAVGECRRVKGKCV